MKREKVLNLTWEINVFEADTEERYCHNCGKKVIYQNSLVRRQNANGKKIYHYAIYKCPKGHTWNKKLESFKTVPSLENKPMVLDERNENIDNILIEDLIKRGIWKVNIYIKNSSISERLDKLLSNYIIDLSRGKIEKAIKKGDILLDNSIAKTKDNVRTGSTLSILVENFAQK